MIIFSSKEYTFEFMKPEFLFVYNANTDPISVLVDYAHKVFKPSTYKCELCELTHHNLGERSSWTEFKKRKDIVLSFWYVKQFEKEHNDRYEYPVILMKDGNSFELILSKKQISALGDVDMLIDKLKLIIKSRSEL